MSNVPSVERAPSKPKWYVPTPAKFLCAVLLMQGVLFLSARYRWFWFNEQEGLTVVFTVAATAVALMLLFAFMLTSWLFKSKAQFGLSTLLLMVPVVAIPCGWLTREIELSRQRREVVEWNQRGLISYTEPYPARGLFRVPKNLPFDGMIGDTLRGLMGEDFFRDIAEIIVSNESVLYRVHVLTQLESIGFHRDVEVDLAYLRGLNRLKTLDLTDCESIGAFESLVPLPALEVIRLVGTRVTDEDLQPLGQMKQLTHLALARTHVTAAGLKHLKGLTRLKFLDLSGTGISDDGLEHLSGLSQLELLELKGTQVSADGVAKLQTALPKCLIVH